MTSIKCSSCGVELDVFAVAAHTCSSTSTDTPAQNATVSPSLPPPSLILPISQPRDSSTSKTRRPLLPRIDPSAVRPPTFLGELTPTSSGHSSIDISPRSASSGQRSPAPWRTLPPHKPSVPVIRRPPSPELISQDCAFPPFPSLIPPRPKTPTASHSAVNSARSSTASGSRSKRAASMTSSRRSNRPSVSSQPQSAITSRKPSYSSIGSHRSRTGSVEYDVLSLQLNPLPSQSSTMNVSQRSTASSTSTRLSTSTSVSTTLTSNDSRNSHRLAPVIGSLGLEQADRLQRMEEAPNKLSVISEASEPTKTTQRPPLIDSGKSMPLLQRFRTIIAPRRAPTAPVPALRREALGGDYPEPPGVAKLVSLPNHREMDWGLESHIKTGDRDGRVVVERPHSGLVMRHVQEQVGMRTQETGSQLDGKENSSMTHKPDVSVSQSFVASQGQESVEAPRRAEPVTVNAGVHVESPAQEDTVASSITISQSENQTSDSVYLGSAAYEEPEPLARNSILQELDLQDLENMVSPAPASGEQPPSYGLIRNSTDSASSYGSMTMSRHSISSSSSLPLRDGATSVQECDTSAEPAQLSGMRDSTNITQCLMVDEAGASQIPETTLMGNPKFPLLPPDSPTDPLFQQGRLSPIPPFVEQPLPSHSPTASGNSRSSILFESFAAAPQSANKGFCRGCSSIISTTQRSVSSADGRLTGRYHKECFVCQTCQSPFATADFYVHDDQPYCAQHYHEICGTICGSCNTGIEGQYMETSTVSGKANKKFHPGCLICATCHTVLQEDYFECNGRIYCEKDAFRLASLPARSPYDSTPKARSPLVRELVTSSDSLGDGRRTGDLMGVLGRFPDRRLTRLIP